MSDAVHAAVPLRVSASGGTDIGKGRRHNEDMVLVRPDLLLYVVADGAGGHNAGNVASTLATTAIATYFEDTLEAAGAGPDFDAFGLATGARRLASAVQQANREVIEIANTSNRRRGMGTTVVALHPQPETGLVHVGHVGDSRCYRLREGVLEPLTTDHSLLNDVLEFRPDMDDRQLSRLPHSVVTRALGMEDPVRVSVRTVRLAPGDRYLLCSDGVTDALDDSMLEGLLATNVTADELVRLIIDSALARDARDNLGVVVVSVDAGVGVGAVARRSLRAAAAIPPMPSLPPAETDADQPEILMVDRDVEEGPQIHLVPAESANEELLGLLDEFDKLHG